MSGYVVGGLGNNEYEIIVQSFAWVDDSGQLISDNSNNGQRAILYRPYSKFQGPGNFSDLWVEKSYTMREVQTKDGFSPSWPVYTAKDNEQELKLQDSTAQGLKGFKESKEEYQNKINKIQNQIDRLNNQRQPLDAQLDEIRGQWGSLIDEIKAQTDDLAKELVENGIYQ